MKPLDSPGRRKLDTSTPESFKGKIRYLLSFLQFKKLMIYDYVLQ